MSSGGSWPFSADRSFPEQTGDSSEQLDGILLGEQVGYERRGPWAQTRAPVTGPGAQDKRLQGGALDLADLDALGAAAKVGPDPGAALASAGLGRGSSHCGWGGRCGGGSEASAGMVSSDIP